MNGELKARAQEIQDEFTKVWTFDSQDLVRPPADDLLASLIEKSPTPIVSRLKTEFFGVGPIEDLVNDPQVQEIVINGGDNIWFERDGKFQKWTDAFLSDGTFKRFVDRVAAESGMVLDLEKPFADGRWRGFRVHMVCAPLSNRSFHITFRRLPQNPWTLEKLLDHNWCAPEQMECLRKLIEDKKNLLFIGPTGCGKTSVLGACLKSLPAEERVVIIEDTDELPITNEASTKLLTRQATSTALKEVSLCELVKQSLRMRPFRLVVGEVRGVEAKDLMLALATGHSGSLGTLHAREAREALIRLEMLVQMGAPQWNLQAIRQLIQLSVDGLVVCGNKNGHRQLEGIFRVAALESFGFLMEQIA